MGTRVYIDRPYIANIERKYMYEAFTELIRLVKKFYFEIKIP